jgi:Leucine-rich repeat (LRR) protein
MSNEDYERNLKMILKFDDYFYGDGPKILELDSISLECPIPEEVVTLTDVEEVVIYAAQPTTFDEKIEFDLSPLTGMKSLRSLQIHKGRMEDLSGIEVFTQLEELDFILPGFFRDLEPLRHLTKLKRLHIQSEDLTDITALRDLTAFEYLEISCTGINDLSALRGMVNLKYLDIAATDVTDLSPLENLDKIEYLNMFGVGISDLTPLRNMTQMRELHVDNPSYSKATDPDIAPLTGMRALQKLHFTVPSFSDTDVLRNFPELTHLYLSGTQVSDLEPLKEFKTLKTLSLQSAQVTDITPVAAMERLENLYLDNTPIESLEPLRGHPTLSYLSIDHTNITDLSPLTSLPMFQACAAGERVSCHLGLDKCKALENDPVLAGIVGGARGNELVMQVLQHLESKAS